MITCPWCGTNYEEFRTNCVNCGGSLPLPAKAVSAPEKPTVEREIPLAPPLPPRKIPNKVMSRMLLADGGMITGGIFVLIGGIFFIVGMSLSIAIVTAIVGVPFAGLGFLFLVIGGGLCIWRYNHAQQIVTLLRTGQAALGEITYVTQNYNVQINGRYPWEIQYRFKAYGRNYQGSLTTLSKPDLSQQPGKAVYVLYQQGNPEKSTLYPSPYGYFGLDA